MNNRERGLITVSIADSTENGCRDALVSASRMGAGAVEIRFDLMEQSCRIYFLANITTLQRLSPSLKFIFTYRMWKHGGPMEITLDNSLAFWEWAFHSYPIAIHTAFWIDWELELVQKLVKHEVKALGGQLIHWGKILASYHDFSGTPTQESLDELLATMQATPAAGMKFAFMSESTEDNERIFNVYRRNNGKKPMVAIGMGKEGTDTRRRWREFNAALAYCRIGERGSAPGQLHISELL